MALDHCPRGDLGRGWPVQEQRSDAVAGQHAGNVLGEELGREAAVVADYCYRCRGVGSAVLEIFGHSLGREAKRLVGEVVPDDAAPAVSAELDRRSHPLRLKVLSLAGT